MTQPKITGAQVDQTSFTTIGTMVFDADQVIGAGQDNFVLTYDDGSGLISLEAAAGGGAFAEDAQLNLFGGTLAGNSLTVGAATNFLAGNQAGSRLTSGDSNVFIGAAAGRQNVTANLNIAIGASAMGDNTATPTGTDNIAIGQASMDTSGITTATGNVAVGVGTMNGITSGDNNVAIGANAGDNISGGDNNVMIGAAAGPTGNQTDRLYINNAVSDTPMIGGNFANGGVEFSGTLKFTERADHIQTPAATFGELWVRNDSPNKLIFTDDAGTDFDLTSGGGGGDVSKVGTPVNNQLGVWTGDGTLEGEADFTYTGGNIQFGPADSSQKLLMTGDGDGSLKINGGDGSFNGANLILYGNTHATLANDWSINAGADGIMGYDDSADLITVNAPMTFIQAGTASPVRIPHSGTPSSLVDGDMWTTTAGLFVRINGSTVGPLS